MIDHEALKAAHPQFRLGHSQGLQDGREDARRDALAEAAEEADRFTCGGCGMDGMAGTAIRALLDEPATPCDCDAAAKADARFDRISDEIAACSGCGGRDWPKDANCPACTDKVDEDIAREAAERDDTPVDAWKRGAEAMGTALLQYCADVNIRDGGVPVALSNLKLPPYQPKVADVMTDTTPQTEPPADIKDDPDAMHCECCGVAHSCEETVSHFDINLCPECDAKYRAEFDACVHTWKPEVSPDGDDGHYCKKCGFFWLDAKTLPTGPGRETP